MGGSGIMASPDADYEARVELWRARLAPWLHPVLDRHHRNLSAIVASLEAAGHPPDRIAACVRDLLASYEADLTRALCDPGPAR